MLIEKYLDVFYTDFLALLHDDQDEGINWVLFKLVQLHVRLGVVRRCVPNIVTLCAKSVRSEPHPTHAVMHD